MQSAKRPWSTEETSEIHSTASWRARRASLGERLRAAAVVVLGPGSKSPSESSSSCGAVRGRRRRRRSKSAGWEEMDWDGPFLDDLLDDFAS